VADEREGKEENEELDEDKPRRLAQREMACSTTAAKAPSPARGGREAEEDEEEARDWASGGGNPL